MNALDQLMEDILQQEFEANKERYVGNPKEIRINHEWFYKLVEHKDARHRIESRPDGLRFMGIPMNRTTSVEKWEIVF